MIAIRRLAQLALVSAFLLVIGGGFPAVVLAHEGGPQVVVDARQFAPGERLEVRGGNIGTDLAVRLELVVDGRVIPLGEAVCDGHGDFTQSFLLPEDLQSGTYTLQAIDPSVPGAEVVLASTTVSVRAAGWRILGISALVVAPLLVVIIGGIVAVWFMRQRSQNRGRVPNEGDARPSAVGE